MLQAQINISAMEIPGVVTQIPTLDGQPYLGYQSDCNDNTSMATGTAEPDGKGSLDALLYIVVVLSFYAFAMIILMIKYIRRENQEAELRYIFLEFVKRDNFKDNRTEYLSEVERIRDTMDPTLLDPRIHVTLHTPKTCSGDTECKLVPPGCPA